jgi:hypothetical protein
MFILALCVNYGNIMDMGGREMNSLSGESQKMMIE